MLVNVNSSYIESNANNMADALKKYNHGIKKVSDIVCSIGSIWYGEAYQEFNNKMALFLEDLKAFGDCLEAGKMFALGYIDAKKSIELEYKNKNITIS